MEENAGNALKGCCPICQSPFTSAGKISALQCGHTFHYLCVSQWLGVKRECPNCRKKISPKSGIIEKLFFDVTGFDGNETRTEVNYVEKAEQLTEELSKVKEQNTELEQKNSEMRGNVKALEKKIIREKERYEKEIPALRTRNRHLEMMATDVETVKNDLTKAKAKLKACEFYQILSYKNGEDGAENELTKYLKANGSLDTDRFFQLMRTQNKELSSKRTKAVREAEKLHNEIRPLKKEISEKDALIRALKKEIGELRGMANVDTPVNKRLRAILMNTPEEQKKRLSMGFDRTSVMSDGELSFFEQEKQLNAIANKRENEEPNLCEPGTSKATKSMNFNFAVDEDGDDDEPAVFKKLEKRMKRLSDVERVAVQKADSSFDDSFDIPIPATIMKRVPLVKTSAANCMRKTTKQNFDPPAKLDFDMPTPPLIPKLSKNLKRTNSDVLKSSSSTGAKSGAPPVKSARISSFFSRSSSTSKVSSSKPECVIID